MIEEISAAPQITTISDPVTLQQIVGGKMVRLNPDEDLESFQPNRPSPTFTGFLEHLRRDSALGMIPFEFAADSSKVGGAGRCPSARATSGKATMAMMTATIRMALKAVCSGLFMAELRVGSGYH